MISKYSGFSESSSSSSSTIINKHHFHHHYNTLSNNISNTINTNIPYYHSPYIPYDVTPSNFRSIGNQIISPNYNPSYYRHKILPNNKLNHNNNYIQGEPVPIHEDLRNKCCGCNNYISDILYLLKEMKGLKLDEEFKGLKKEEEESEDSDTSKKGKKNKKSKKDRKKKEKEEKKKQKIQAEKWWKLTRAFVYVYSFYSVAKKFCIQYCQIRNNLIELRTHSIDEEISLLQEWVLSLEEPCWEEFEIFIDENCAFEKGDSKNKIRKESLKIIAIIKKYVEYLISGSSKLSKIPERIQQIIYEYIKDGAYFPKKYLTTFQISRLNFEFYGSTKDLTDEQSAMILAFLLLSVIASQKILCNIRETVKPFKNLANVIISTKYIASILHYLTRDTFKNDLESIDDIYSLFNYYRNYHIINKHIENDDIKDIAKDDYFFEGLPNADKDEYSQYFVNEEEIEDFFKTNNSFVETFKNYIFMWALKLSKLIKEKFSKKDPNLLPRKPLLKPEDKIYNEEEEKKRKEKEEKEKEEKEKEEKEKEEKEKEKEEKEKEKEEKEDEKEDKKEEKIKEKKEIEKKEDKSEVKKEDKKEEKKEKTKKEKKEEKDEVEEEDEEDEKEDKKESKKKDKKKKEKKKKEKDETEQEQIVKMERKEIKLFYV